MTDTPARDPAVPLDVWAALTLEQIAELEALLVKATPGEWKVTQCCDYWISPVVENENLEFDGIAQCGDIDWPGSDKKQSEWQANAFLLVALHNSAGTLITHARQATASAEREARLRKTLEYYADRKGGPPNDGPWGNKSTDFGRIAIVTLVDTETKL